MTRPVLVTGGAGFIGRAVVELLARAGRQVLVLDSLTYASHPGALAALAGELPITLHVGDVTDPTALDHTIEQHHPDGVLHLAAESHVDRSLDDAAPFLHTNVTGTWQVVQACLRHDVGRLVHVSSDEVYGDREGAEAAVETDPCTPTNPYSVSKAAADQLVLAAVRAWGLDAVITRGVNTFGPGQFPEKLLPLAARRWRAGEAMGVYGDGRQERHWQYVDDHARGVVAALEADVPSGSILHLAGHPATNEQILARWAAALGIEPLLRSTADRPGHDRRYALDDRASRAALALPDPLSLDEGLARTAAWHATHPDFWDQALAREDVRRFFARRYGEATGPVPEESP